MSQNSVWVIEWRQRMKKRLIEAMGGECCICGYNRCDRNLSMHHVNPEEKMFAMGKLVTTAWKNVVFEARKCVLLCHNCHGEVHEGITVIPESAPRFNEEYAEYADKYMKQKKYKDLMPQATKNLSIKNSKNINRKKMIIALEKNISFKSVSICYNCHKEVSKDSKFCSDACNEAYPFSKFNEKACPECNKNFISINKEHCSRKCYNSSKILTRQCLQCKTDFRTLKGNFCGQKCYKLHFRKVVRPPLHILENEVRENGFLATGRKYGVSDNAIRKWIKAYKSESNL